MQEAQTLKSEEEESPEKLQNAPSPIATKGIDVSIENAWERALITTKEYDSYLEQGVATIQVPEEEWRQSHNQGLRKEHGLQPDEVVESPQQETARETAPERPDTRFRAMKSVLLNPARIENRIATLESKKEYAVNSEDFGLASSLKKELTSLRGIQLETRRNDEVQLSLDNYPAPSECRNEHTTTRAPFFTSQANCWHTQSTRVLIWETLECCCVAAALPFLVSWVFLRFFFLNSRL